MIDAHNFLQPQRQSPKAIVLILLKYFRVVVRQLWPILLIVIINPDCPVNDEHGVWLIKIDLDRFGLLHCLPDFFFVPCFLCAQQVCG